MSDLSASIIKTELNLMKEQGIDFDYKRCCSKVLAVIKLDNGKMMQVCPFSKTVKYTNKMYKYKNLRNWMVKNGLKQ